MISASEANQPFHDWERDEQEDWEDEDADKQDAEQGANRKWQSLLKHVRDEAEASLKATEKESGATGFVFFLVWDVVTSDPSLMLQSFDPKLIF